MTNQNWMELSERLSALAEDGGRSVVRVEARRAPASGVVWSPDGVVVTAHHNVEWDEDLEVGLADGRSVRAELLGRDPSTDLAVLRVQASGLPAPAWADPDSLKAGHLVLSLSRPGRALRVGLGPIARAADAWRDRDRGGQDSRRARGSPPFHGRTAARARDRVG